MSRLKVPILSVYRPIQQTGLNLIMLLLHLRSECNELHLKLCKGPLSDSQAKQLWIDYVYLHQTICVWQDRFRAYINDVTIVKATPEMLRKKPYFRFISCYELTLDTAIINEPQFAALKIVLESIGMLLKFKTSNDVYLEVYFTMNL